MDTLEVHLNREKPQSIDVGTPHFETDRSFDITLQNHGFPIHVHIQIMEDLTDATELTTTNYFLDENETQRARVTVTTDERPIKGRLKIVTGYGSNTEHISVELTNPEEVDTGVRVSEDLARPRQKQVSPLITPEQLPVVALGIFALIIALATGIIVGGWAAVIGILIVIIGLGIAGLILLQ